MTGTTASELYNELRKARDAQRLRGLASGRGDRSDLTGHDWVAVQYVKPGQASDDHCQTISPGT